MVLGPAKDHLHFLERMLLVAWGPLAWGPLKPMTVGMNTVDLWTTIREGFQECLLDTGSVGRFIRSLVGPPSSSFIVVSHAAQAQYAFSLYG